MKWWRFYSEALDDPKVQLLPADTFKGWVNLLCLVNETEPSRGQRSGYLPARVEDIAYKLHGRDIDGLEKTQKLLSDLVTAGLFEQKTGRYHAHNWSKRQPVSDDAATRMKETRKGKTDSKNDRRRSERKPNNRRKSSAPEDRGRGEEIRGETEGDSDRDKDTEVEEETARSFADRLRLFGLRPDALAIQDAIAESGQDCVLHCLEEAELHNKLSFAYADQIRRRHQRDGCPDPELRTRTERMLGRSMN